MNKKKNKNKNNYKNKKTSLKIYNNITINHQINTTKAKNSQFNISNSKPQNLKNSQVELRR